jgi:hypothetical protein
MQLSLKTAEELIVPTIRAIENDLFPGSTANQTKSRIYEQMHEIVEELTVPERTGTDEPPLLTDPQASGVAIVPFVGEGDELVGNILEHLLEAEGIGSSLLPWKTLRSEKLQRLQELGAKCVVISAIEARSAISVGKMARSLQISLPDAVVLIGLWSLPSEGAARLIRKIKESQACSVYTDLDQAVQGIASLIIPGRLEERLESERSQEVKNSRIREV